MRLKALYSFVVLVVCCRSFSQEAAIRSLQIDLGNNFLIKPVTITQSFSPSIQLNMVTGKRKDRAISLNSVVGLGYNYCTQTFIVRWLANNSSQLVQDRFFTHEFLVNLGGITKYTRSKFSVGLVAILQGGPNFAWTNDPRSRVYVSGSLEKKFYKWEFLQFYFVPGFQLQYDIEEDLAIQFSVMPRIFLYGEYLREDQIEPVKFNYAPVKVNLSLGMQARIFR